MNDIARQWAEPTVSRLREYLPNEPTIDQPEDLAKAVDQAIGQVINRERGAMWSRLLGKQVLYPHPSGVSFWVRLGDGISMYAIRADRDDAATRLVLSHLTEGGTFFDVGANTGWFTLRAAARYRELGGGQVHAFEPQPVMADLIRRSIAQNALEDGIELHQMALGNEEKTVWMATPEFNSGGSTVRFREIKESFEVPLRRLDALKLNPERIDIMKVDIEGSEPLFVEGAEDLLRKYRPLIYSELHPTKLQRVSNRTREDYLSQMEALGYTALTLDSRGETAPLQRSDLDDSKRLLDVLFRPQ